MMVIYVFINNRKEMSHVLFYGCTKMQKGGKQTVTTHFAGACVAACSDVFCPYFEQFLSICRAQGPVDDFTPRGEDPQREGGSFLMQQVRTGSDSWLCTLGE